MSIDGVFQERSQRRSAANRFRSRRNSRAVVSAGPPASHENLARRTNLVGVKSVCMALQQAERYGAPMAQTLRVMTQENRDMRMAEVEKKAAGLPRKLTYLPMILFFLPVLLIVILRRRSG